MPLFLRIGRRRLGLLAFVFMAGLSSTAGTAGASEVGERLDDQQWMARQAEIRKSFADDHVGGQYVFGTQGMRVTDLRCSRVGKGRFDDWHCPQLVWASTIKPYAGVQRVDEALMLGPIGVGESMDGFLRKVPGCRRMPHEASSNLWALGDTKLFCEGFPFSAGKLQSVMAFFEEDRLVLFSAHYSERVRLGNVPGIFKEIESRYATEARDRSGRKFLQASMNNLTELARNPEAYFASTRGQLIVLIRASAVDVMEGQGFYLHLIDEKFYLNQGKRMAVLRDQRSAGR